MTVARGGVLCAWGCSRLPWGAPSRPAPPLPLVVLPPDGVSTLCGPVPPKTAGRALIGFALNRARRPRLQMAASAGGKACAPAAGFRCAPPVPAGRRRPWPAAGRRRRQPPLSSSRSGEAAVPAAVPARVALRGQNRGACSSGLWPPRRCGGAPLPQPRPLVLAPGRWMRRLRAALKPSCTRCAGCMAPWMFRYVAGALLP